MKPECPICRPVYTGADERLRCRMNGLQATPANAEGCKRYEREPGSDDAPMVWLEGGWCVTSSTEGRGD